MIVPAGFDVQSAAGLTIVFREADRDWLVELLRAARTGFSSYRPVPLPGGRGATVAIDTAGRQVVIRGGRRGGLPGRLVSDLYFGWRPRVWRELELTAELQRREVPVAVPLGAAVQSTVPGCYRSWIATARIKGAVPLHLWLEPRAPEAPRETVLRRVGEAVRRLHAAGVQHHDLNLTNIMVGPEPVPTVTLIDFDRAVRVSPSALGLEPILQRLRRSARRLGATAPLLTEADLDAVRAGYQGGIDA